MSKTPPGAGQRSGTGMKDNNGYIVVDENSSPEEWQKFYELLTPEQRKTLDRILYPGFSEKQKLARLEIMTTKEAKNEGDTKSF